MSQLLPRFRRRELERKDHAHVTAIVTQAEQAHDTPTPTSRATAAGDTRRLRGIPAIGRNVPGHIAGTRPDR